jgi:tRNA dimethylallyltransferase
MSSPLPPLVVIAGPTASGKSAIAIDLASRENGVVINADASQCYADLEILSARPALADMANVPHRLFGFLPATATMSAAGWADHAKLEIAAAHREGRLPIIVGGTGLYIRTLLQGIAAVPDIEPGIRAVVRKLSTPALAAAVAAEDPVMAARLMAGDTQRLARALEVVRSTGRSLAAYQQEPQGGIAGDVALRPCVVDIGRDALIRRCDNRFDAMMAAGAMAEVAALHARGIDRALPVMKAIGVPPLLDVLDRRISLEDGIAAAKLATRRYAKRQLTWFRNQTPDWPRLAAAALLPDDQASGAHALPASAR